MEDIPIEMIFQEEDEVLLSMYDQDVLNRMSQLARSHFIGLENVQDRELDFQQKLHLQVHVQEERDIILRCNLDITEFVTKMSRDSHAEQFEEVTSEEHLAQLSLNRSSSSPDIWYNKLLLTLECFKRTLTLREAQLTMVLFIAENHRVSNFEELYIRNYGKLAPYIIPLESIYEPINLLILDDLFRKQSHYLKLYSEQIQKLKHFYCIEKRTEISQIVGQMKILHSKIKGIVEIFPWACIKDKKDLFSAKPFNPRWQHLTSSGQIRYIFLADKQAIAESFADLRDNLMVINAAMSILDKHKHFQDERMTDRARHIMQTALKVVKVALFKKDARHEASIMMAEPKQKLAREIWNIPESKKLKKFIQLSLPSIQQSQVLYLPRHFKQYFYQKYENNKDIPLPKLLINDPTSYYQKQLLKKTSYNESIRIRLNSPYPLKRREVAYEESIKKQSSYSRVFSSLFSFFKSEDKQTQSVIFHIHGGGFISMSSFIHQAYTRVWATNLNVPIISVDYGKAPDRPYPMGLYDCLEAYMWTIHIFQQLYEVKPKKIILVGDSAGSNLCAALTNLLLMWDLPLPTGLVLVYPALNLNIHNYTPSILSALNDMILPHTFLKICLKAYLQDEKYNPKEDCFISPIVTPQQILARYPKTEIIVGNKDPFHDDCCRLVEKMNHAKPNNARLAIFEEFPHGFLQLDLKIFPNQYARAAAKEVQAAIAYVLKDHT